MAFAATVQFIKREGVSRRMIQNPFHEQYVSHTSCSLPLSSHSPSRIIDNRSDLLMRYVGVAMGYFIADIWPMVAMIWTNRLQPSPLGNRAIGEFIAHHSIGLIAPIIALVRQLCLHYRALRSPTVSHRYH